MKKAAFITGLFLAVGSLGITVHTAPVAKSILTDSGNGEMTADSISQKIEGEGFDTPEEAVGAYLKGLQNNDINAMLSAFAIETYAQNYSLAKTVDKVKAYAPTVGYIPNVSDMSLTLNIEQRRAEITETIRGQYLVLTDSAIMRKENVGQVIPLDESYESGEDMVGKLFAMDDEEYLSNIVFDEKFYDPALFNELYSSEQNQTNLDNQAASINADEIRSVVANFASAGTEFVLYMDTVRYDDKWFALSAGGNIGGLEEIDSFHKGLMPIPTNEVSEFHQKYDKR